MDDRSDAGALADREEEEASYIDYETFLSPSFSAAAFANALVLSTNNPNDLPLDLSTPLSRVLFDAQEIDSHVDLLTTRSAVPLLEHAQAQNAASRRIVAELDSQVRGLNESYRQLEREVIDKHAEADEVRVVASRLWDAQRLAKAVVRCLQLGRQLEVQHGDVAGPRPPAGGAAAKKEDHHALVRCVHTVLSLREILERTDPGEEGHGLHKIDAVRSLQEGVIGPIEASVRESARRIVREFAVSPTATFAQAEESRNRTVSAMVALYLLSPTLGVKPDKWTPRLLLDSLEDYLRTALQTTVQAVARSLGQLPTLDRTLADVSARCQNLVALELVLDAAKPPAHPLLPPPTAAAGTAVKGSSAAAAAAAAAATAAATTLLRPLLAHLETGSLPSYFWRSVASSLSPRVHEIVNRGGAPARTLRTNRAAVGDAIRECVLRGCRPPAAALAAVYGGGAGGGSRGGAKGAGKAGRAAAETASWDREAAVMVGSVVNNLGR